MQMRDFSMIFVVVLAGVVLFGCEFKKNISREEIPIIKQAVGDFEAAVRTKNSVAIDSSLANESDETVNGILGFAYTDSTGNPIDSFVGFTSRQIFFRGDAARVDCSVTGPDGLAKDVTITLKKEDDIWRVKRLERRVDNPLAEDEDDD